MIRALTAPMSVRPWAFGFTKPMTLPMSLTEVAPVALIAESIAATGAASLKDMGKVMALVKPKAQGRADMGAVSARIKQKLS